MNLSYHKAAARASRPDFLNTSSFSVRTVPFFPFVSKRIITKKRGDFCAKLPVSSADFDSELTFFWRFIIIYGPYTVSFHGNSFQFYFVTEGSNMNDEAN
jgi:hypothetical protein